MCGIAGLIHRGKSSNVGSELQGMLQALKHRGEDSTGYALYGDTDGKNFIMRFKVGENVGEGSSSVMEDVSVYDERKKIVDQTLARVWSTIFFLSSYTDTSSITDELPSPTFSPTLKRIMKFLPSVSPYKA